MRRELARVANHHQVNGDYRILDLFAPAIAREVQPGQFVHVRIPRLPTAVLRRPFSVYRTLNELLSILYRIVGRGTLTLSLVKPGDEIDLIGPLGNGFPLPSSNTVPVLVAGGYGVAPLYLLASRLPAPGTVFIGGATRDDILCEPAFLELHWETHVTTEDGSAGTRGVVTDALDRWLLSRGTNGRGHPPPEFFACGPDGLLRAVADRAIASGWKAWLSLDRHMGCGVGACLACVQRIRTDNGDERWVRTCREGPVFEARQVVWEDNP